ncbi:hypothetical protein GIB67_004770 [Kingdonia uniflora]|uniref:Uncharacterized protein n=1 Tax=Kingdonia uniflora TaxID=39325 RepID=A0A7J7NQP3_9MAGN|nr:hypothetical protein GIB67_004770 [Kingdonia uniflora]
MKMYRVPSGIILHSYLGSAEMVPGFVKFGTYFSFFGYLMSMKPQKAKKMLKSVSNICHCLFEMVLGFPTQTKDYLCHFCFLGTYGNSFTGVGFT